MNGAGGLNGVLLATAAGRGVPLAGLRQPWHDSCHRLQPGSAASAAPGSLPRATSAASWASAMLCACHCVATWPSSAVRKGSRASRYTVAGGLRDDAGGAGDGAQQRDLSDSIAPPAVVRSTGQAVPGMEAARARSAASAERGKVRVRPGAMRGLRSRAAARQDAELIPPGSASTTQLSWPVWPTSACRAPRSSRHGPLRLVPCRLG